MNNAAKKSLPSLGFLVAEAENGAEAGIFVGLPRIRTRAAGSTVPNADHYTTSATIEIVALLILNN